MSNAFILETTPDSATLNFNRPEKHNALDVADLAELDSILIELAARPGLRLLTLKAGGKSFCAGVDLTSVAGHDWRDNPLERVADRLESLPFPTLCLLHGGVYGGGTDLALACDFRLGAEGIKTFIPPAKLGIQYHPHGLERAVTRLGLSAAKRLFLAAETFDAAEMLRCGFLDWLVPAADFAAKAEAVSNSIRALAPLSLRGMKQTLNEVARGALDLGAARARSAESFSTEDFQEGRRAMAEKRAPAFIGR